MSRSALIFCGLVLLGCKSGSRTTDSRSAGMQSIPMKLAFLKDYMGSPTAIEDVEFHLVFQDNSGGFLSGPSDFDLKAALKVKPDDVSKWADGCTAARLDVRPEWVGPMLKGKPGWVVRSQPDTYRCGREERVIHVSEGVIFRRITQD